MAATMYPTQGLREWDPQSKEDVPYYALRDGLSNEFTVIHSQLLNTTMDGETQESELDFIVFHKELGILCIEAKNTLPTYRDGEWYFKNGTKKNPYRQVLRARKHLRNYMNYRQDTRKLVKRCKLQYAVWWFTADKKSIVGMDECGEADAERTMFESDLDAPEAAIRRIMSLEVPFDIQTDLSDEDERAIIERLLCPACGLVPSLRARLNEIDREFYRLLEEQQAILKFLKYQRVAAISGPAGSGKTMIAKERARMLSERGENVLFLCFNTMLRDALKEDCAAISDLIHVDTISGFAGKGSGNTPDYESLALRLLEYEERGTFPYKHVIVDEGQDFGFDEQESEDASCSDDKSLENAGILGQLVDLTQQNKGSFYIFYDKNQAVQNRRLPAVINNADCKCTLYANCRNTKSIAECSTGALKECKQGEVVKLAKKGSTPQIFFSTEIEEQALFIDKQIELLKKQAVEQIVILTCKSVEDDRMRISLLKPFFTQKKGKYVWKGTNIPIYTCRTFKGLEAEAVILVDVSSHVWPLEANRRRNDPADGLLFYTGASRAKYHLAIVCDMDKEACEAAIEALDGKSRRNSQRALSNRLKTKPISIRELEEGIALEL